MVCAVIVKNFSALLCKHRGEKQIIWATAAMTIRCYSKTEQSSESLEHPENSWYALGDIFDPLEFEAITSEEDRKLLNTKFIS